MGNRVIGLDIGTHAVRAVELSVGRNRPVLHRMGQVALPHGAVVAGEVVDPPGASGARVASTVAAWSSAWPTPASWPA